jgi:hypothetical protein
MVSRWSKLPVFVTLPDESQFAFVGFWDMYHDKQNPETVFGPARLLPANQPCPIWNTSLKFITFARRRLLPGRAIRIPDSTLAGWGHMAWRNLRRR